MKRRKIIHIKKLSTARWWPTGVPEELTGEFEKVVRMRSGAVMASIICDGRQCWVPWSKKFIETKEVNHE